jgi:arsenite oxidase large subunit
MVMIAHSTVSRVVRDDKKVAVKATDAVPRGMIYALMYHWLGTANSLTSPYTDPKSTNPWHKGTRAGIQKFSGGLPSVMATTSFLPTNKFD